MTHFWGSSLQLKSGQWMTCESTREKGQIESYNGTTVCVLLADGITLYATPEGLENLGWKPTDA
ncbi:MAG: hypothetical protein AAGF01_12420 [Cyanobacteria bacterium P01_G01_bin.38]